jgi:hypothetical protein
MPREDKAKGGATKTIDYAKAAQKQPPSSTWNWY